MITPRTLLAICCALTLASCASQKLYKEGATEQDMKRDGFECQQQVLTMYGGMTNMGAGHAIAARGDIQTCLEARGYRVIPGEEAERILAERAARQSATPAR